MGHGRMGDLFGSVLIVLNGGTPGGPNPANHEHDDSPPWKIPQSDANWIKPVYDLLGTFLVLGTHSQVHD